MITLSVHTRVGTPDDAPEPDDGPRPDPAPRPSTHEALNTILVVSPGHPSMWLFK